MAGTDRFLVRVLACLLVVHVPNALGQSNTTTPAPTTGTAPASNGTVFLRIRVNGVLVDLSNCTFTDLGGVTCNSNLQHDVSVTRADSSSAGTETWVIVMIVVNSVLLVIVMGVAIGSYFRKGQQPQEPEQDQQQIYDGSPGYAYSSLNGNGARKVIHVNLEKLPKDAVMA